MRFPVRLSPESASEAHDKVLSHMRQKVAWLDKAGGWHWHCLEESMVCSTSPPAAAQQLAQTRQDAHPFCYVCSASNPMGLALRYTPAPDGSVSATFLGNCALEGYSGMLHGGVIAALLDGAMTNCLFARGIRALTGDLRVRYRSPVQAAEQLTVRAWVASSWSELFHLEAELTQAGKIRARAQGKFMRTP
jgi:acyl-coenzyme A thioesterase PaaI-like protein